MPAIIGIYSAIFPLLAYALFGSSRQLIVGPDAATCLLVAASLAPLAGGDADRYLAVGPITRQLAETKGRSMLPHQPGDHAGAGRGGR